MVSDLTVFEIIECISNELVIEEVLKILLSVSKELQTEEQVVALLKIF